MAIQVLRTRGLLTVSGAALALALAAPAYAQTAPGDAQDNVPQSTIPNDAQAADQAPEGDAIVVTGSRIRATPGFDTPNPVVSLGSETLQSSGTTNLTDFLTGYPALQGSSGSASNSGDRAGIGYTGLNLLDLRNLGTQRTLVLVDGRRHVAGVPGSAAIDINTIPNDLVDRIEVLTGGASAIYGADGVTGVVNFIMKKNFNGLTARVQAGISEFGDAGQRLVAVTAGKNFADGRGNVAIAYEYGVEDRLETRDRATLRDTNYYGFYRNPNGTSPTFVPLNNVRYFDTNRQGGIDIDQDGFPDYIVGNGGVVTPFDPGKFVPNFYQQGGNATLVSDYGNDLLPQVDRHVVNALAHYDFSDAFKVFVEGKYARTNSFSLAQPTFDYYLVIPDDNPYIPASLRPQIAAAGIGSVLVNRDNFDFGQRGENIRRETYRGVFGVRGDLSPHLNYEASYTYGRTDVRSGYVNDILDDRFYAAIDVVQGPNGPTCRVNVQPGWTPDQPYNYTREEFAPTTFKPGQCVPLNLFGEGAPSQAALDFIRTNTTDYARIQQHVVSAYLSGDTGGFFKLPGGPVGFSLGAEYRKEKSSFTPDPIAAQGLTFTNALSQDDGSYDVKEVFGEVRLPLLKDNFIHRLEVGGAVRYSDYSSVGTTTSWKVDGAFSPIRDITFNGTYSKAVRAPNIGELYSGASQTFEFITDPCLPAEIQFGTQYRAANCQALLASLGAATPYRDTRSTNIPGFSGGNPNLQEERGTTWTAGVQFQPSFLSGLSVRADWYDIKLEGAINTVTSQQVADLCVDQPNLNNVFCSNIVRQNGAAGNARAGNIVSFTVSPQNVAQFRTAGLDVNFNYRLRTDNLGTFNLSVVGNYLDRLEFTGTPGADVTNSRGEANAPKYTVNSDLTWAKGGLTLNYGILWFSKTLRYSNQAVAGDPTIVAPEYLYLKEHWQHDAYASYDVNDRFQIYGGVRNIWGQRPDIGTRIFPVNSIGRFGYVGARIKLPSL